MGKSTLNDKSLIHRIAPSIPLIGSFIIFLGVLRLIIFYNHFNVDIISYLEFTEIVTSFLDIIVISVFVVALSIIQNLFVIDEKTESKRNDLRDEIYKETSFLKRLLKYFKLAFEFMLIGLVLYLSFLIQYYFQEKPISELSYFVFAIIFPLIFVIILYEFEIRIKEHGEAERKNYRILFYGVLLSLATVSQAKYQAYKIEKKGENKGYVIFLDSEDKLVSNSKNYFVGKTSNFVFYYRSGKNRTDVIPMSRVNEIQITKKRTK